MCSVHKEFLFIVMSVFFLFSSSVSLGFASALFVYYHRKLVDLRRRYRKYTFFLEYR